jgi:hypothetical protein
MSMDSGTPVSFKNDLAPKFASACGLSSSCHQDQASGAGMRVFLGCNMTPTNTCAFATAADGASTVWMGIVNKPSQEDPPMPYIKPMMPDQSYLLHKIEGTQGTLTCVAVAMDPIVANSGETNPQPCGALMPLNNPGPDPILPGLVRSWINQGALNN